MKQSHLPKCFHLCPRLMAPSWQELLKAPAFYESHMEYDMMWSQQKLWQCAVRLEPCHMPPSWGLYFVCLTWRSQSTFQQDECFQSSPQVLSCIALILAHLVGRSGMMIAWHVIALMQEQTALPGSTAPIQNVAEVWWSAKSVEHSIFQMWHCILRSKDSPYGALRKGW